MNDYCGVCWLPRRSLPCPDINQVILVILVVRLVRQYLYAGEPLPLYLPFIFLILSLPAVLACRLRRRGVFVLLVFVLAPVRVHVYVGSEQYTYAPRNNTIHDTRLASRPRPPRIVGAIYCRRPALSVYVCPSTRHSLTHSLTHLLNQSAIGPTERL
ncbi:hypothetical protein F4859DRAFT_500393, partial [Xylaria cf. heliscus]